MNMVDWAKREIDIACKSNDNGDTGFNMEYVCDCYNSALKAFQSICKDGHSGMTVSITKYILDRLIDGFPLTPIEDTDDVWDECAITRDKNNDIKEYRCNRMSSLFKSVTKDGRVSYSCIDQCYCRDCNTDYTFTNELVRKCIEELYPITMPYMPKERIEVITENFLVNQDNGDFDTLGIYYAIVSGEKVEINRFFIEATEYPDKEVIYNGWIEIDKSTYELRKQLADKLRIQNNKDICENSCAIYSSCQKQEEFQNGRRYCEEFITKEDFAAKSNKVIQLVKNEE